ncbi:MAG: ZIP family metal transporter [Hydrogenophaga sp.]|uniref:ZIP family metal transporter n=1 Tax=Hydrogenophaga sp. TaxID=1904254 RepID=UPI003D9AF784
MTALIRQVRPVWLQFQQLELPVPPHALRNALLALGVGVLLMAGLAAGSTFWGPTRVWWDATGASSGMTAGVQASLIAALATAVGALPVFLVERVSKRQEAAFMAFAAGVMLAAAIFALLLPSLDAGRALMSATGGTTLGAAALTSVGLALGMALMIAIDRFTPHEHAVLPPAAAGHAMPQTDTHTAGQRAWLMVLAILIHNVPEGLAVGAAYAGGALGVDGGEAVNAGASVALAIGLQNMPEGLIVAMALRSLGQSAGRAWAVAALSGLAEPFGAIVGLAVLGSLPAFYPIGLAVAAGAMLFVISHEIIPETHRNGFEGLASVTLMAGFVFMLLLNAAL